MVRSRAFNWLAPTFPFGSIFDLELGQFERLQRVESTNSDTLNSLHDDLCALHVEYIGSSPVFNKAVAYVRQPIC